MGRGGARIGAGRKPLQTLEFPVIDGGLVAASPLLNPPDDLPEDQVPYWRLHAKRALSRGTLIEDTVPAFRSLCEIEAELAVTKKTIDHDGRTFIKVTVDGAGNEHQELKPHPLMAHWRSGRKDRAGLFQQFMLGPFGKPVAVPTKTKVDQQKAEARTKFFGVKGG